MCLKLCWLSTPLATTTTITAITNEKNRRAWLAANTIYWQYRQNCNNSSLINTHAYTYSGYGMHHETLHHKEQFHFSRFWLHYIIFLRCIESELQCWAHCSISILDCGYTSVHQASTHHWIPVFTANGKQSTCTCTCFWNDLYKS